MKIKKKCGGGGRVGGRGGGVLVGVFWLGCQCRCERKIEDFVKNKKQFGGSGGLGWGMFGLGGVRVDVNEELKFL